MIRSSVDELVLQRLADKRSIQDILLDALKQRGGEKNEVAGAKLVQIPEQVTPTDDDTPF